MIQRNEKRAMSALIVLVFVLSLINSNPAEIHQNDQNPEKLTQGLKSRIKMAGAQEKIPVIVLLDKSDMGIKEINEISVLSRGGMKRQYNLINAVSAKLSREELNELSGNRHVKRIYYDWEVHALPITGVVAKDVGMKLTTSTRAIGAYYVQNTLNYTGRNITVAVIDTGIDYTHPDLGGGFGGGYKVKGGYDFINDDSNPMDDNGHGTHCAGIVGARGTVTGVAPDVDLLAVKVLDSDGSGSDSLTLAGIDWAVANGADVISLSLGSSIQPNDGYGPLEMICDAAVDNGVTVVVAAGNEGPGTGTIGNPASAEKVISVGASDDKGTVSTDDDIIADFSCRGPSAFGRFDPDLVAPGVGIYSTVPDGSCELCNPSGYSSLQGTSMATPHVAGAAALLLEYNESLSPTRIKSLLIHSSGEITGHPFEAGAGMINISRAIESGTEAFLNNDDCWEESTIAGMNTTAILKITNNQGYSLNFTISISSLTDVEGDHSISNTYFEFPKSTVIGSGEEKEIQVKFSAPAGASPGTYASILEIESTNSNNTESIRIPVAITIPLFDTGIIEGTVDDDYGGTAWGDWRFYKLMTHNGTSVDITLNWSDSSNDLDMYLFAPNGILVGWSGENSSTWEHILLTSPVYHGYWVAVYAYDVVPSQLSFSLIVSYPSSLRVESSMWQGSFVEGEQGLINFTLINDGTINSNLGLDAVILQDGASDSINNTIGHTSPYISVVWQKSTGGLDLDDARYLDASLSWGNPLNDLDLYFVYNDGYTWNVSRFISQHRNDLLGVGQEDLAGIDIKYYLEKYPDIGIGISNSGSSQGYTLALDFTDESSWGAASVSPPSISSLSPHQTRTVQVSVNTASLVVGETYNPFLLIKNSSDELIKVPMSISLYSATTTTTTTTITSTTTTTIPTSTTTTTSTSTTTTLGGECSLVGDTPPCGEVTLAEVIDLINLWAGGQAQLGDVVALINAWAGQ